MVGIGATGRDLKVLLVEDSEDDAELIIAELERGGFAPKFERIASEAAMRAALARGPWDIILADYTMPKFNGLKALGVVKSLGLDLPFIIVSGSIGEDIAVAAMRAGAHDYIMKDRLARLAPAVERELKEAAERAGAARSKAALQRSEGMFRELLEAAPDAMIVARSGGEITLVNAATEILFGYSAGELVGMAAQALIPTWQSQVQTACAKAWSRAAQKDRQPVVSLGVRGLKKDGREFPAEISINSLAAAEGQLIVVACRDVSERWLVEQELKAARDAAEQANRAKSAFLANMSHEIRTPLTAIMGFAELLEDSCQPKSDYLLYASTIRRNCQHLTQLIDDILDLSKVEAKKLTVETIPVSLPEVISSVIETLTMLSARKGLYLRVKQEGKVPETVLSDPCRLKQILSNVIGNAIKFTQHGGIEVVISATQSSGQSATWNIAFAVTDTGIGIATDHQSKLFQIFSQVDSSTTRNFGGSGLGLALARSLAEALGGDIVLTKSVPGEGSTFTVTIQAGQLSPRGEEAGPSHLST